MKKSPRTAQVYDFAAYRERRDSGAGDVVDAVMHALRPVDEARHREEQKALENLDLIRRVELHPEAPPV